MARHLFRTLGLLFLLIVIPLVPAPELLTTWPVLVTALAGFFLNLSQPPVSTSDLKRKDEQDRRSVLLLYLFGALSFLVPVLDYAYFRGARPPINTPWSWIGLALILAGFFYRYWAIRTLGKWFTSLVRVQEGQTVIRSGPYRRIRHPSYVGAIAMLIGVSVIFRSYAGVLTVLLGMIPAYLYRITAEEALLCRELGEEYEAYRKSTWRIVPPIY